MTKAELLEGLSGIQKRCQDSVVDHEDQDLECAIGAAVGLMTVIQLQAMLRAAIKAEEAKED